MSRFAGSMQDQQSAAGVDPTAPGVDSAVRISPNRLTIDDRFPSLSFIIQTAGLPYFEVLLTTDRALFDPGQDPHRNVNTFYSSRQDSGLIDASLGQDSYLVPQAVLQTFARQQPKPSRIYYTAIAYADNQGNAPRFAHLPQTLPQTAPSVELSPHFTGSTLSRLLGMSLGTLQTIGSDGRPVKADPAPKAGGLPLMPPGRPGPNGQRGGGQAPGAVPGDAGHGNPAPHDNGATDRNGAGNGGGNIMTGTGRDAVSEANRNGNGQPAAGAHPQPGLDGNRQPARAPGQPTNGNGGVTGDPQSPQADPDAAAGEDDFQYDDGFGALPDTNPQPTLGPADIGGYGDDDFGIPPTPSGAGNGPSAANGNGNLEAHGGHTHAGNGESNSPANGPAGRQGNNGNVGMAGNGHNGAGEDAAAHSPDHSVEQASGAGDIPALDEIGTQAQSLQAPAAWHALSDTGTPGEVANGNGRPAPVAANGNNGNGNTTGPGPDQAANGNGQTAAGTGEAAGTLSNERKRHIIERVGAHRQPAVRYDALSLDGAFRGRFGKEHPYYQRAHDGLSYGIAQFNQDSGQLGTLLSTMQQRDSARFEQIFGPSASQLVQMTMAAGPNSLQSPSGRSVRVQALDGKDLWEEPWTTRFREAAQVTAFQSAQNQVAAALFLDPMIDLARWFGINSERGLALLYDRAISQQPDSATAFLTAALSDLTTDVLRNQALDVIKTRNPAIQSVGDFQDSMPGLQRSEQWDSYTIAALHGALRALGADSPIALKDYTESMAAIGQAASAQAFATQVQRILSDDQLGDDLVA